MKDLFKYMSAVTLLLSVIGGYTQEGQLTFGLQFKPMLPVEFINAGDDQLTENGVSYTNTQNFGYVGGGLIRYGITDYLALETGITFVQRNYTLNIDSIDNAFVTELDYRMIGYEIPLTAMVFVRLDQEWFMSASLGGSIDLFPSDVSSSEIESGYLHETVRYRWAQASILSNIGFEYRSHSHGIFYLGGSFHLPFRPIYMSKIGFYDSPLTENTLDLRGTYLTLDLRFYFPQKAKRSKM